MSTPTYDIIVFGATSFVGQILCQYLVDQYGVNGDLKWAAAGRSEQKLNALTLQLGQPELPLVIANADDVASLREMCDQTQVVVSTVGPYALYGEPLVKACAESGTHYCDLTGEVQWIPRMINAYEDTAKKTGARLVHCCGFDSIPSDLGVLFLQNEAKTRFGSPCETVHMRVKAARGGVSGGTVASMMNVANEARNDPGLRKQLANPYALCPPKHGFKARQYNVGKPEFDKTMGGWLAPFIMASINTRIVHRSNALLNNAYGSQFKYDEAMLTGKGPKGLLKASAMAGGIGTFFIGAALKPSRWLLENYVVPKPGEGPSPEDQKNGFYDLRFIGVHSNGETLRTKVVGQGDPGYGSTGKMLGEAAVSLARDVPEATPGGFWTPASLLGTTLIDRLQASAELTFEVE